jgi:hypothetical protein
MKNPSLQKALEALNESILIIEKIMKNQYDGELTNAIWLVRERMEYSSAIISILNDLADHPPNLSNIFSDTSQEKCIEGIRDNVLMAVENIKHNPRFAYEKLKIALALIKRIKI